MTLKFYEYHGVGNGFIVVGENGRVVGRRDCLWRADAEERVASYRGRTAGVRVMRFDNCEPTGKKTVLRRNFRRFWF